MYAQSSRAVLDFGVDDTTSMLFRFESGATGYLGTVIATAETWRLQVFGSNGWAEVGDVEHLMTWKLKLCTVDRENLHLHRRPRIVTFPETGTGMPAPLVDRIQRDAAAILTTPEMKESLLAQGCIASGGRPEELSALIRSDYELWSKVIKTAGVKLE